MEPYLTTQIITYMGNKRKLLPTIQHILEDIERREGRNTLTMGDGFSGSGIVSRLLKTKASKLYTNDISDYSLTLNECFLRTLTTEQSSRLQDYIHEANQHADQHTDVFGTPPYISGTWAPLAETIQPGDRVYFTYENGRRLDVYRNYIETVPEPYKSCLLGVLLVEASIHNNTNGQFSAFYKDGDVGKYGGKNSVDVKRIEQPIHLRLPVSCNRPCEIRISQLDALEWAKQTPPLDVVYYDPPYNKHPYSIYYFFLNILQKWDKTATIPDSYRGQPVGWHRSEYNSIKHAEKAFDTLMMHTKAKYVLVSYNSGGIISIDRMDALLAKYGTVEKIPVEHKTYNRLRGISEYKRTSEKETIREFFWLLTQNE